MKMTIDAVMDEVADMQASVETTRENISAWYDWLSAIRDEQTFVKGREGIVRYLDSELGELVLMLVAISVSP
jgi:hypothetical protein